MRIAHIACLAGLLCFAVTSQGISAETKVGVVDMAALVKAHPDTKPADTLLEKQVEDFELEQKEMQTELEKRKKAFEDAREEAMNKALNQEARSAKEKIAEEKLSQLRDYDRKCRDTLGKRQKEINDQRLRMQKRIVNKIKDIITQYATKNGYSMVFDKSGVSVNGVEPVVFAVDKADLTPDILKLLAKEKPSNPQE